MGGNQSDSYNEEVPDSQIKGFTPVYRRKGVKELLHTPEPGIQNLHDLLKNTIKKYGNCRGIGQVQVTIAKDAQGKDVESRSIAERTYLQIYDSSRNLGRALVKRGLYFVEPEMSMRLIGIYSRNRYEWFITDWACIQFGLTSVPLYDTLGIENLTYCLHQTKLTTVFATIETIGVILKLSDLGVLHTIVSYDPVDEQTSQRLKQLGIELLLFKDLLKQGETLQQLSKQEVLIKPSNCYTFSYTSGTTGPPKGAMISHQNILAFCAGIKRHSNLHLNKEDVHLSYLPLPHIMERAASMMIFYQGAYLVVSSGNTLKLKDDCLLVKPTLFVSVPRIFNRIVDGVKEKFEKQTGVKKMLIDWGVSTKLKSVQSNGSYSNIFYDNLIFKKVRQSFGGRIRLMVSGSAPLNPQVHAYMKAIMCCPLIQAYGQTQNTASILYGTAYDTIYGALALVCESAEVKLCDIPEMRYTSQDKDENGLASPRGQIWIRGPQVFLGYYKLQQITRDTITSDGWLRTGDIGQILPGNLFFKIIDRKKNIFKLQQGEYVAPDKVQNIYFKYRLITELFLHGEPSQNFAVAIITPNRQELIKLAQSSNVEGTFEELCSSKQIRKHVLMQLNNLGKAEGLYGFEQAKNIYLEKEGFASRNILTNTMKLIRFEARQSYKNIIADLYKEGELLTK